MAKYFIDVVQDYTRGHPDTTWTIFQHFLPPPPLNYVHVDIFYESKDIIGLQKL